MMILGTLKDLDEAHIGDWDLNMALYNYLSVLDENYGQVTSARSIPPANATAPA